MLITVCPYNFLVSEEQKTVEIDDVYGLDVPDIPVNVPFHLRTEEIVDRWRGLALECAWHHVWRQSDLIVVSLITTD